MLLLLLLLEATSWPKAWCSSMASGSSKVAQYVEACADLPVAPFCTVETHFLGYLRVPDICHDLCGPLRLCPESGVMWHARSILILTVNASSDPGSGCKPACRSRCFRRARKCRSSLGRYRKKMSASVKNYPCFVGQDKAVVR